MANTSAGGGAVPSIGHRLVQLLEQSKQVPEDGGERSDQGQSGDAGQHHHAELLQGVLPVAVCARRDSNPRPSAPEAGLTVGNRRRPTCLQRVSAGQR